MPDWQRKLLRPHEQNYLDSFPLLQLRLQELYGESQCNATCGAEPPTHPQRPEPQDVARARAPVPSLHSARVGPSTLTAAALRSRSWRGHEVRRRWGCDLTYGSCLNITGGNVYEFDQNGTCRCHHWFTGGDCSEVDVRATREAHRPQSIRC